MAGGARVDHAGAAEGSEWSAGLIDAYYNENDPVAAQWLRNLIAAGHIAPGDVDERSIEDVRPDELTRYRQCHFFAGVGVWSYALRAVGWPDDRPVWTGSCPCQPFSSAGKGEGFADERHLWPAWFHLISQRRPAKIVGEQVANHHADPWIDLVQDDLETLGYAVGAVPFPSAGVGAPHVRDRLYWLADGVALGDAGRARLEGLGRGPAAAGGRNGAVRPATEAGEPRGVGDAARGGWGIVGGAMGPGSVRHADGAGHAPGGLALAESISGRARLGDPRSAGDGQSIAADYCDAGRVADGSGERWQWGQDAGRPVRQGAPERGEGVLDAGGRRMLGGLADADGGNAGAERQQPGGEQRQQPQDGRVVHDARPGPVNGLWRAADWLLCRDGKWRPVEPGTFPLAHGLAGGVGRVRADQECQATLPRKDQGSRVGRLRAYGNAINAQAAIAFLQASLGR